MRIYFLDALRRSFSNLLTWIFLGVSVLAGGVLSTVLNILGASNDLSYLLLSLTETQILLIPCLAAALFSKRSDTARERWLSGLGLSRGKQIFADYFVGLTLLWIPNLLLLLYPTFLGVTSRDQRVTALLAVFGYAILQAALLSICAWIASRFCKKWLAATVGAGVCLGLYLVSLLSDLLAAMAWIGLILLILLCVGSAAILRKRPTLALTIAGGGSAITVLLYFVLPTFYQKFLPRLLSSVALFDRLNGFCSGRLDLPSLAIYVGIAAVALLLLISAGNRLSVSRALPAILLILCVIGAQLLPFSVAYPCLLKSSPYRIPEKARQYLLTVDESVELIYYAKGGRNNTDRDFHAFLLSLERINPHLRVSVVDTADAEGAADQSVEIRSARRSRSFRIYELYYYLNSTTTSTLSMEEYTGILQTMEQNQKSGNYNTMLDIYGPDTMKAYFSGSVNLTAAIRYVLAEEAPTVYTYAKNGGIGIHPLLRQRIEQSGYTVGTLQTFNQIPQDCSALLLSLSEDLSAEEAAIVSAYLADSGKLFLTTAYDSPTHPNLSALLDDYGLSSNERTNTLYQSGSQIFYPVVGEHPVNDLFDGRFVGIYAHAISLRPTEGVTHTVLLQTAENASCIVSGTKEPLTGQFPFAVAARKGDTQLVWLAMTPDARANGISSGANFDYCVSALQWFAAADSRLVISDTSLPSTYYEPTSSGLISWVLVFIVGIPAGLTIFGAIRIKRRKRASAT